ncbi:hypothetical protein AB0368_15960 [Actinoplanes sp. NPDC051475]|uniref:hypothetical protein n=1 Tax=Actinoplanes sp. NPDC051475 TaxID=3157225 RepID=UPI00344DEEC7
MLSPISASPPKEKTVNTRTPLVLAAAALTALVVTGCSSNDAPTAAPATAATPAAGGTTAASVAPVASKRPTTAKPAGGTGCPVSEATLLRAFRESDVAKALAPTETLTGITCYKGFALGLTHPEKVDNAEVVFEYKGGAWHAVNGGTADYCDGIVPEAIRPHLKHC